MVFSSFEFLLIFLPATYLLVALAARRSEGATIGTLLAASVVYYAYWNWVNLLVLVPLAIVTYLGGRAVSVSKSSVMVAIVVSVNLGVLGFFKYSGFVAENLKELVWPTLVFSAPILPLGISFFVFQKIAFVVDVKRGVARFEAGWAKFLLFVMFFPQLIAGPIVHWRDLSPQLNLETMQRQKDLALGLTLFVIGLAKKTLLADLLSPYVGTVFDGDITTFGSAALLIAATAYALQIYFDFSGYSDMAVGIGLMFGIKLPWNFLSPYKATSIIEFWRRWHVTLSQFLRDYLYIPLGGNRLGYGRRLANLMLTMLLGGLWHGAGWNFVLWGGLHGGFLVCQQSWMRFGFPPIPKGISWFLTLILVLLTWIPFRAKGIDVSLDYYIQLFTAFDAWGKGLPGTGTWILIFAGAAIAMFAPNTKQLAEKIRFNYLTAICVGLIGGAAIVKQLYAGEINEFIYFQF